MVEVHNRGVKVLTDKGVLLGACVLSALAGGAVSAAVVVWLLLAVAVGGLCAVVEHRREAIAAPACYLVLGCFTTASQVGARSETHTSEQQSQPQMSDCGFWV